MAIIARFAVCGFKYLKNDGRRDLVSDFSHELMVMYQQEKEKLSKQNKIPGK